MIELYDWNITATNNNQTPPSGWPENMDYREVNNTGRETHAVLRRFLKSINGENTSAGAANEYTITSGLTFSAYAPGQLFGFVADRDSTGLVTLNVDAKGSRAAVDIYGTQLGSGDIKAGCFYLFRNGTSNFRAVGQLSAASVNAIVTAGLRTNLAADRTYYVRTDGNDANTGLVDNAGGAFLTVQHALDVVYGTLDLRGFNVTIQLRTGTFGRAVVTSPQVGAGNITLVGDSVTPSNVVLSATAIGNNIGVVDVGNYAKLAVRDLTITAVTSGTAMVARTGGVINFQNVRFSSVSNSDFQILATQGSIILATGNYEIAAGGGGHIWANSDSEVRVQSRTVTVTGTPAFASSFIQADYCGIATVNGNTWSGAATGKRFNAANNGVIAAFGGLTEFPGNVTGTVASGGLHPALADPANVGKQTVWVPAASMTPNVTNGPASGTVETTTNKVMIKTLNFDPTTQESAQFEIQFPKSWDLGTVSFRPVWSHAATATNFGVVWGLQAFARSDDDAIDQAFGSAQGVAGVGGTTDDLYREGESAAITIGGTPAQGDNIIFRMFRDAANGSDSMTIDARLHGIELFFTTNANNDA